MKIPFELARIVIGHVILGKRISWMMRPGDGSGTRLGRRVTLCCGGGHRRK